TLPNSPEWKFTAMLDYFQTLESMPFDLIANVVYVWQDEVRFGIAQDPLTVEDSYGLTNLRAGIVDKENRYELTAFVNNAFDESYRSDMLNASSLYGGSTAILHINPRNAERYFGVRAKFNF
ncbi:MAG: TonB-dependent receptor, partial [Halioglobus sp.]